MERPPVLQAAHFSQGAARARRRWVLGHKCTEALLSQTVPAECCQLQMPYTARLPFTREECSEVFPDKGELRAFITSGLRLQEVKETPHAERTGKQHDTSKDRKLTGSVTRVKSGAR